MTVKNQRGFAVFSDGKEGLLGNAISFFERLTEKKIGEGAFDTPLPMFETKRFLASPIWKRGKSTI